MVVKHRALSMLLVALFMSPGGAHAEDLAGVGARPLTPTLASTYFIESVAPPDTYTMAAVVFLLGEPGWTKAKTDWTFSPQSPAYSNFEFPDSTLRIEFRLADRVIELLGEKIDSSLTNVLVVDNAPTSRAKIVYREKLNLSVPFESDPLREVVKQSEPLRKALGLE
jgi:hypothetical protein